MSAEDFNRPVVRCDRCRLKLKVALHQFDEGLLVEINCGCGRMRRMSELYPSQDELHDAMRTCTVRWRSW